MQQKKTNKIYNGSHSQTMAIQLITTAFDKPRIYTATDSYCYLLPDSDILENIIDSIHKEGGRI